jgi:sugar/nucleoside kinase (ribokinase family)
MRLVPLKRLVEPAHRAGYAVPHFNVCNLETVQTVLSVADELRSPVILGAHWLEYEYAGTRTLVNLIENVGAAYDLDVAVHLDHGRGYEDAARVLAGGFTSVMFDGSSLPLEENVAITEQVVALAAATGASVEGEIGTIGQTTEFGEHIPNAHLADPRAAERLAGTGIDILAVAIGNVPFLPVGGQTVFVRGVTMAPGGDAVNQSVALAALGHEVGLMTAVGADRQGSLVSGYCRDQGVDVSAVTVTQDYPTTTSIVIIDDGGERSCITSRGGTAAMYGPEHADLGYLRPGLKVLSVASLFCSRSLDLKLLLPLLRRAKELGAITVADLVNDRADGTLDELSAALAYLDYIIPSRAEAEFFAGTKDPVAAAEVFRKHGIENVVIKLGRDGSYALTSSGSLHVPAFDVPVVDTTGSGDNFVAGFVSGLVLGLPLEETLRRASATAALSVQAVGASSGVRRLGQLADALRTLPVRPPGIRFPVR